MFVVSIITFKCNLGHFKPGIRDKVTADFKCVSFLSEGFPNVDISWTQIVNIYNYGEDNAD